MRIKHTDNVVFIFTGFVYVHIENYLCFIEWFVFGKVGGCHGCLLF